MLRLVRILTFKWYYRDGTRFRTILQNEMKSHYDRVGAERGKGMFLRMKVSTDLKSCSSSEPTLNEGPGGKFEVYPGKP